MAVIKKKEQIKLKEGVVFAIVKNGQILLEERTNPKDTYFGYTIIPGGGIKPGEDLQTALRREIREECDVAPISSRLVGIIKTHEGKHTLNRRYVFIITKYEGVIINAEPDKSRHVSETLDVARKLCSHPISQQILDLITPVINRKGLKGD